MSKVKRIKFFSDDSYPSGGKSWSSGILNSNASKIIYAEVIGPCNIIFAWKKIGDSATLQFLENDTKKLSCTKSVWYYVEPIDVPPGYHKFVWKFRVYSDTQEVGNCAWIDSINISCVKEDLDLTPNKKQPILSTSFQEKDPSHVSQGGNIREAIEKGAKEIILENGTYRCNETIQIPSNITIRAQNHWGAIIDGGGSYAVLSIDNQSNILIKDLFIINSSNGIVVEHGNEVHINSNNIKPIGGAGICIRNSTNGEIIDNTIKSKGNGFAGISLRNSEFIYIKDNNIITSKGYHIKLEDNSCDNTIFLYNNYLFKDNGHDCNMINCEITCDKTRKLICDGSKNGSCNSWLCCQ
jgi:hypothetical protein